MADVSIAGLQWFILIPWLNHMGSHRPIDSHSKPCLHREKNIGIGTRTTNLPQSYESQGKQPFVSDFSCLLWHAIKAEVLFYTVKTPGDSRIRTWNTLLVPFLAQQILLQRINDSLCDRIHSCPFFQGWLRGNTGRGLEKIFCRVLIKKKNPQESRDRCTGHCVIIEMLKMWRHMNKKQ